MFKGKAFCEASIYLFSKPNATEDELAKRSNTILMYRSPTVRVTEVNTLSSGFDAKFNEHFVSLSVRAEVLVKYDPHITHLNDYRIRACTILREQLPRAGAVMAHSIDTYSPLREKGFNPPSIKALKKR